MSQTELSNSMRAKVYLYGAITTVTLAISGFMTAHIEDALIALSLAILLALNSVLQTNNPKNLKQSPLTHITALFFAFATLLSLTSSEYSVAQWSYIFPLLLFFLYPIKVAATALVIYSTGFLALLTVFDVGSLKVELMINYLLCVILTFGFVYLREAKDRQLKPLRRTDNLTQASTREHLNNDLEKEIQRSEREGADLTVMMLAIDEQSFEHVDSSNHDILLNKLGRTLHENLREFDSYYRWKDHEFVLILPYTNTNEAIKKAKNLRLSAKKSLSDDKSTMTVSIGAASLNVGDSAESMLEKSFNSLRQSQKKAANRAPPLVDITLNT